MKHAYEKYEKEFSFKAQVDTIINNLQVHGTTSEMLESQRDVLDSFISPKILKDFMSIRNSTIRFQFRSYAPSFFHALRLVYSLEKKSLLHSLCPRANKEKISASSEQTAGNSGQEIMFTKDKKFIIKSAKTEEKHLLIDIIWEYVRHITQNRKSMIAKIYGIFSLSIEDWEPFYFILMENLDPFEKSKILFKYDRKFSTKNRFALKKQLDVEHYRNIML